MLLSRVTRHNLDVKSLLQKATQVAEYAINSTHYLFSSAEVKHIGLPSVLSNAVMRKYGRDKKTKRISRVIIPIPKQAFKYDGSTIRIPCLKATIPFTTKDPIQYLELSRDKLYIIVHVEEALIYKAETAIGVDLNSTGHIAVAANISTGKVQKLGKKLPHIRNKYKNLRRKMQAKNRFGILKRIGNREKRIKNNENHQISRRLVNLAYQSKASLVLEDLKGIRRNTRFSKQGKDNLHSWPFYDLQNKIEYKAKLLGVPVIYINPHNTSAACSRCGSLGGRNGKEFKCTCGHIDHADSNAAFNIANRGLSSAQSIVEERSTDTRKRQRKASQCLATQEPQVL